MERPVCAAGISTGIVGGLSALVYSDDSYAVMSADLTSQIIIDCEQALDDACR